MSENNIMEGITLTSSAADKVRSALKIENKEGYYLRMKVLKLYVICKVGCI